MTHHLLGRSRLIDEGSRETSEFTDPRYLPFYYHLGSVFPVENLMEIGFRLGLPSACLIQGCKNIKNYFGFREKQEEYYSQRLARGNIKDYFRGKFESYCGLTTDSKFIDCLKEFKWDVVLIDEETSYDKHRAYLDLVWSSLAWGGLLVVDYLDKHEASRKAFREFCATHSREPVLFPTRYGVGIIQR